MPTQTTCTILLIAGMKDNVCREAVSAALEILRGVTDVQVNLYRSLAIVRHDGTCTTAQLVSAVKTAGYAAAVPPESKRSRDFAAGDGI